MRKLPLLLSMLSFIFLSTLFAERSLTIFSDTLGDENKIEAIGFIIQESEDSSVKILLNKENFKQGYSYKGTHKKGEYSEKYLNNIYINAKSSQELFIYSPAIKTCELEFELLKFNGKSQEAIIRLSASLVGTDRRAKVIEEQELHIKNREFLKLKKLLKIKSFKFNYQTFTNRLRAELKKEKIKLFRGSITKNINHQAILFKTNTIFEITMLATNDNMVISLNIKLNSMSKKDKKMFLKIIKSIFSVVDKNEYQEYAQELFQGAQKDKKYTIQTKNAKYTINRDDFYEVLPLFN